MNFFDIKNTEPSKQYCRCEIVTNKGNVLEVDYYDEWGIFYDDNDQEYGWKDNGENPELVIKWREI